MKYKVVSDTTYDYNDLLNIIEDINSRYVEDVLYVKLTLDTDETSDLLNTIVYDDTQIALEEYDIYFSGNDFDLSILLEDNSNEEYKYIKETLSRVYSPKVLKEPIKYILNSKATVEHFTVDKNIEEDSIVTFTIKLIDFNNNVSAIRQYIDDLL